MQEQLNRRIYQLSSRVEPANAKFAEFLGQFTKEEIVIITLGFVPAESGCWRPWAAVFVQEGRRMALTGKEVPETSDQQIVHTALQGAFTWEHPPA
jgi:hypothetical protein